MNQQLLKAKMVEMGKTQGQVALEIGMSEMSLSRKIRGKREFHLSEILDLCLLLKIQNPVEIFLPEISQKSNDIKCM